ncbi:hypothetical protein [Haloferula sp. BvORR071]|uniref:hypothetical protein n=1 Tax=Haloferula sp. BvORR071 TaxID=1396141 RepID=UPI000554F4A2|nr:hypothetical protein [Haloferula sp. BvORR071]
MSTPNDSAAVCFRTGWIDHLGGHVLLIGACQHEGEGYQGNSMIREYLVVFPDETPWIAQRIVDQSLYGEPGIPLRNAIGEARRLLGVAKSALRAKFSNRRVATLEEVRDAVAEGDKVDLDDIIEMRVLGLLGPHFPKIATETSIRSLAELVEITMQHGKSYQRTSSF